MKILITGGAGFIGSHLVIEMVKNFPNYLIYNLDKLTYAGNLENLIEIESFNNYKFIKGDITDPKFIQKLFQKEKFDSIIHLAAESHVDRSIQNPLEFVQTNVIGTVNLLNSFKNLHLENFDEKLFYHVSTDEVYGSLDEEGLFTENTPYDPRSPYSASKASSDHFVRAYGETYNMNYIITNCSNNYGEFQYPEKLIPLFIKNILENKNLPVYGDGNFTRDWLYVKDHVKAIIEVFHNGKRNNTYNIGGFNEWKNIDLINLLCLIMDKKLCRLQGSSQKLISFIKDRPGHDKRYAIDATKISEELDWKPSVTFEEGLEITVDWYLKNSKWLENIINGDYMNYYNKQYKS
tara:strand:+ start:1935 stop:2981 length:1047 start_codon:yes stop_codon:yes gene_type:complete